MFVCRIGLMAHKHAYLIGSGSEAPKCDGVPIIPRSLLIHRSNVTCTYCALYSLYIRVLVRYKNKKLKTKKYKKWLCYIVRCTMCIDSPTCCIVGPFQLSASSVGLICCLMCKVWIGLGLTT